MNENITIRIYLIPTAQIAIGVSGGSERVYK